MIEHYPFMETRVAAKADVMDKFSPKMDESCVRAFAVFGPLRCLQAAFSSFEATKYRGMFQQIFPCLAHISGVRTRIHDLSPQEALACLLPLDDGASVESAVLYRLDPESAHGRGKPDYVLRTIPGKKLEEFKARHKEINWDNPDKEELAGQVFAAVPEAYVRCDAIIDVKTDSVTDWLVKTRAQLITYGNEAALQNMTKGFAPRPVYLMAVDADTWRAAILDPMGAITVEGHALAGFQKFGEQQQLRANWIAKKDPGSDGYFATVEPWTLVTLQARLDEVNRLLRYQNTSGVAADKYLVSNLWDSSQVHHWNGRGLEGQLLPGTLLLCEGLLRLACGDKVCDAGWTAQKLRMVFARQHEMEINRCFKFESGLRETPPRSLDCTYSREVERAAFAEMRSIRLKPSAAFHKGFMDSIANAKHYLSTIARVPATSYDALKVGRVYGGREFLELLDDKTRNEIGTSIHHIIVDGDTTAEDDSVQCFEALVIDIAAGHLTKMPMLKKCEVLVCYDMRTLCHLWRDLYVRSRGNLVVFCRNVDEEALSMLRDLQAEAVKVVTVCDDASLNALTAYLSIDVVDDSAPDLVKSLGNADKIVACGEEVIVYRSNAAETGLPLHSVLELQVSGATPNHFNRRVHCVLTAATAMNSALNRGVIPGNGIGLLAAVEALPESSDADYNAGLRIVKQALKVIEGVSPTAWGCPEMVSLFTRSPVLGDEIDLRESAEATLDALVRLCSHSVSLAVKRQRPCCMEVVPGTGSSSRSSTASSSPGTSCLAHSPRTTPLPTPRRPSIG